MSASQGRVRLRAVVGGQVQGVGFRWWTGIRAGELGLAGHAENLPDGRVEISVQGSPDACERLLALLDPAAAVGSGAGRRGQWGRRRPGRVTGVTHEWLDPVDGLTTFVER